MLEPWVTTYEVEPPSAPGARNDQAVARAARPSSVIGSCLGVTRRIPLVIGADGGSITPAVSH